MRPQSKIAFDYKTGSPQSAAANHAKWFVSGLVLPLVGALVAFYLTREPALDISESPSLTATDLPSVALPVAFPLSLPAALSVALSALRSYLAQRYSELRAGGLDVPTIFQLVRSERRLLEIDDPV